ncbi:hypothetical protein SAMN04487995_1800 [Dyadobacter koreensis]|uniref:Uncharacterized protein n=1 Tax=Dyadobacter koreensis TaxID=408657 RepID=A0A1H6T0K5_9BACT|nr:hypothetical protein SAMN04487995_1800 [Dyadobacter koreensis]
MEIETLMYNVLFFLGKYKCRRDYKRKTLQPVTWRVRFFLFYQQTTIIDNQGFERSLCSGLLPIVEPDSYTFSCGRRAGD